jgi:hypothetical protein
LAEEAGALVRFLTELVAEHAEGAGGVAEAVSDLMGGLSFDEEGAEGFILALERLLGGAEEIGGLLLR